MKKKKKGQPCVVCDGLSLATYCTDDFVSYSCWKGKINAMFVLKLADNVGI